MKAINQKKEALLDPHKPLSEELLAEDKAERVRARGGRRGRRGRDGEGGMEEGKEGGKEV